MDKKMYFASDFHLGAPNFKESSIRERLIVQWLEQIKVDCAELFLMGDIFDFWFEYRYVVPKGYIRLLGKLAELADSGIKIYFFKGNHDMWVKDYFENELNFQIISDELLIERNGKKFYLHHGDGLGPGDRNYKVLRKIFRNPICQTLFGMLPPAIGMGIAQAWSHKSRASQPNIEKFMGSENEWLAIYANEILKTQHFDYFVFGHRHLPLQIKLNEKSEYINIGEWITYFSYGVFDGEKMSLKYYKKENQKYNV